MLCCFLRETSIFGKNFKVIFLVRDPRGSLHSLSNSPDRWKDSYMNSTVLCQRLMGAIKTAKEIQNDDRIKDRFLSVKYEDLVVNSSVVIDQLCPFLGAGKSCERYAASYKAAMTEMSEADEAQSIKEKPRKLSQELKTRLDAMVRSGDIPSLALVKSFSDQSASLGDVLAATRDLNKQKTRYYYGQKRSKYFRPDHWRTEIDPELNQRIMSDMNCVLSMKHFKYNT